MQFKFYVLNYNHTTNRTEMYNIFNNIHVQKWTERAIKKYMRSPKNFAYKSALSNETTYGLKGLEKEIESIINCEERGRFEYEIGVCTAFERDIIQIDKWDCARQATANIETITNDVLRQYKKQMKEGAK